LRREYEDELWTMPGENASSGRSTLKLLKASGRREIAKLCEEWVAEILADGPIWYKDLITLAEEKKYSDGQLTRVKGKLNIQDDWAERKIKGKKPKKGKFWFLKKQAGVKPKAREIAKSRRF
jgi:hypothetical protein